MPSTNGTTCTSKGASHQAARVVDGGNDVHAATSAPASPLRSILRMWHLLAATAKSGDQYRSALHHLQALEQDNLSLRDKVEQLTKREASARYLANHDGLTGLCNRSLLMDRFVQASAHARRGGYPMALLLFDIDGFKTVNDRFGYLAGDRLLQRVADQLVEIAQVGDTSCRYGGDEFVLLLPSISSLADAERVEKRVREGIADCMSVDDIKIDLRASCGIALYPHDGANWHDLMQAADAAMYRSKAGSKHKGNDDKLHDRPASSRHDRVPLLHLLDAARELSDPDDIEPAHPNNHAAPRPSREVNQRFAKLPAIIGVNDTKGSAYVRVARTSAPASRGSSRSASVRTTS